MALNSESHEACAAEWTAKQEEELTLAELLHFFRHCHRSAPFLLFLSVLDDGRVAWRTDAGSELVALPESLARE